MSSRAINQRFPGSEELFIIASTDAKGGLKRPDVLRALHARLGRAAREANDERAFFARFVAELVEVNATPAADAVPPSGVSSASLPLAATTGLVELESVLDRLQRSNVKVILAGLTTEVSDLLERAYEAGQQPLLVALATAVSRPTLPELPRKMSANRLERTTRKP